MSASPEIELLHRAWEAMTREDLTLLEGALAPDATWRAPQDGPWNCEGRAQIIDVIEGNLAAGLRGRIEETIQHGPRVMVAFRPEPSWQGGSALDAGIAYMVVTIDGGRILEMKGASDRATALAYTENGVPPPPTAGSDEVHAPEDVREPPAQRVSNLIPFVRVSDVKRSVTFYENLGFLARSVYTPGGRLVWAALESEHAELMLSGPGEPIDAEREGVLFYLYSPDLPALRDQLVAAGIHAGEIEDGTPGPRREMRVVDPDGYVLMIAQIE